MTTEALGQLTPTIFPTETSHETQPKQMLVTTHGTELFAQHPDCRDVFINRARGFIDPSLTRPADCKMIGNGNCGRVYELPGFAEQCFKISTPDTMRIRKIDLELCPPPPNLISELRFMSALQKYFAKRPETGIHVPKPYAAITFENGTALLQERIPQHFESLKKIATKDIFSPNELYEQEELLIARVQKSLGATALRLGIGDLRGTGKRLNGGNIFTDQPENPAQGNLYIIDLIGNSKLRRIVASLIARAYPNDC